MICWETLLDLTVLNINDLPKWDSTIALFIKLKKGDCQEYFIKYYNIYKFSIILWIISISILFSKVS
jgi:hypothetical protein